jgi:hypothetical protein
MAPTKHHRLSPDNAIVIKVRAGDRYSPEQIEVYKNETYQIWCDKGQWWFDLLIPATPNGYFNPLANLFGQRLKGTKCFCLCGAYNDADRHAFAIGKGQTIKIAHNGKLSFFANDVRGYEWNNWGSITVNIKRVP